MQVRQSKMYIAPSSSKCQSGFMRPTKVSSNLKAIIGRLNDHILANENSPYLLRLPGLTPRLSRTRYVTPIESKARKESHDRFRDLLQFQVVEPSVMNRFLKQLYPMRNNLSALDTNTIPSRNVNHNLLFRSYCALPHPGVGHMEYQDFERFMNQMFSYRAFLKPNALSGTNILLFNDSYLLKQYREANHKRQVHLNMLWQITNDMDSAGIPTSDRERQNLIYKTFFRDRIDIMEKVSSIMERNESNETTVAALSINQSPSFDFETYKDVSLRFGESPDAETLNVLLLIALRHKNVLALLDIMSRFQPEAFTRDTYKILLENLALMGREKDFEIYLDSLVSRHLYLMDIQLLNTVVLSLVNLHKPKLAASLVDSVVSLIGSHLSDNDLFLKLIKKEDKEIYALYISAYDRLAFKPSVKLYPTERTFLPILKHYCQTGAEFAKIAAVLSQVEAKSMSPVTSQMFKLIFHAFVTHNYSIDDLRYVLSKLIELHDLNSGVRDTWIRDQIHEAALPQDLSRFLNEMIAEPETPGYLIGDNNFVKLSNGLVRQVFLAFHHTLGRDSLLKEKILEVERELNEGMESAKARHDSRIVRDEIEMVDLYERDEMSYLKKSSLLKLLDISLPS